MPNSAVTKRFYTLSDFAAIGGPGRVKCYYLDKAGVIALSKDAAGRTGLTIGEVERYFALTRPLSKAMRNEHLPALKQARKDQAEARRSGKEYKGRTYDVRGHRVIGESPAL